MHLKIIFVYLLITWLSYSSAEQVNVETPAITTAKLLSLLKQEDTLINNLENYVQALQVKQNDIQRAITKLRSLQLDLQYNLEQYLHNPLKTFVLKRHQHEDWHKLADYMDKAVGEEYINTAQRLSLQLPTAAELKEASRSIETLATEHNLQLYQLAAGKLFGNVQPDAAFSALDCYAMARYNIREHAYLRAEVWLRLALAKYQKKDIGLNALYGLAQSNMDKWLAILLIKRRQYDAALRHVNSPSYGKSATDQVLQHYESKMQFKQNCNANLQRPTHLHCRYNTTTTPFLRIAPLKMEELSMNPYMVIYHDAISNKEIEVLLSKHLQFKPALVSDERISHQRSAKDVVIDYSDATVNQAIYARLQDMSGIEDKGTKLLSLINYGIGGHYDLHLDAYNSSHIGEPDRIATLLFYLGNVEAGGATIFPNLKLTIKPTKGSALFWHNLKSDGNIHEDTLHAACPVIVGSKYVLSKWIENV